MRKSYSVSTISVTTENGEVYHSSNISENGGTIFEDSNKSKTKMIGLISLIIFILLTIIGFVIFNIFFTLMTSMGFISIMVGIFCFGYSIYSIKIGKIIGSRGSHRYPEGIEYTKYSNPIRFWITVFVYWILGFIGIIAGIILIIVSS